MVHLAVDYPAVVVGLLAAVIGCFVVVALMLTAVIGCFVVVALMLAAM